MAVTNTQSQENNPYQVAQPGSALAGATQGASTAQVNPTATTNVNQSFGNESSGQFMIKPFMQPFPFEQQQGQQQQYINNFSNWLASQETPEATRQRFENRYGYQDVKESYLRGKEQMADIQSAARATPQNVAQRASNAGTVITQSQIDSIVNDEVKDLMQAYADVGQITEMQGQRLALIEQNMNDASKLEMARQQQMATPWLQEYDLMNINQAREYSGWTFANQLELNRLVSNQQAGLTWTNAEAQRAHELSMQERAFQNSLKYLEKQNEYALDLWG